MASQPKSQAAEDFGQRVAALMRRRNLSSADMAKTLDVSVDTIEAVKKGTNVKKYLDLGDYARALGTTPDHLLGFVASGALEPGEKAASGLDEASVTGAIQGLLEWLGIPRDEAQLGARTAVEVAKERQIDDEDPETLARISAKLRAQQTMPRDDRR